MMTSAQFTQWQAYARVQPFGDIRADWHHARTQSLIANYAETFLYALKKTRTRKKYKTDDFIYPRKKTQSQKSASLRAGLSELAKKAK